MAEAATSRKLSHSSTACPQRVSFPAPPCSLHKLVTAKLRVLGKCSTKCPKEQLSLGTAYVRNLSRFRDGVDEGCRLFTKMPERNAVLYLAMIMGFVNAGWLYEGMPVEWRDPFCSNILLNGYLKMGKLEEAVGIFDGMLEKNCCIFSSMVNGRITEARELFDLSEESRNEYTWCAMMDGYMKAGQFDEGFNRDEEKLRLAKRLRGIRKSPGCIWITVKD